MGENPLKVICEYPPGSLRNATSANDVRRLAIAVKNMPGVGRPFLVYNTLPGLVSIADFEMYPEYKVSANEAENEALINTMLVNPPMDALTF